MSYFVVGGRYRDTSFREMVRADPPEGPFDDYDAALASWRAKSIQHIDEAFVRYVIVRAPHAADAEARAVGV